MYIDIIVDNNRGQEINITVSNEYSVKLIFFSGPQVVHFYGQDHDLIEAARQAVQAFLDGTIYERRTYGTLDGIGRGYERGIIFAPQIGQEIRDIILTAIDLKTGNDRNKLTGLMALPG